MTPPSRKTLLLRAALLACLLTLSCAEQAPAEPEAEAWVTIRTEKIPVELAESPEEQSLGLGRRDSLTWGHGMYFPYERAAFHAFWMKGMRFDIDIVWIRDGRIVDITPRIPAPDPGLPEGLPLPTYQPRELADGVLEVPAGYAEAHGWRIGDRAVLTRRSRP